MSSSPVARWVLQEAAGCRHPALPVWMGMLLTAVANDAQLHHPCLTIPAPSRACCPCSPDHASSPSLAFSASLSHSISLGAASEHTGVSSGAPRAALPAVKARSPAGAAAPPPGSLEGSAPPGTPPAGSPPAAAVAEAAEPGSPVTLQPPPESQHAAAAEAAASGGWWSPGQSVARLAPPAGAEALSTGLEGSPQSLSPLAAALPPGQAAREGETPPAGGRRRARRRHSSPFLARDCSEVDVFCPDRYSLWTQRQQDGAGGQPHTTLQRPASAGAAIGRPASAAARQPPHWQAYATSLEDAELGMGHDAAAGSPPEVAASGGRRLRHAFSRCAVTVAVLIWRRPA